jgi:hypothetical protein
MHKHTQTTHGQEKLLFINLRMFVQCVQNLRLQQSLSSLLSSTSNLPNCSNESRYKDLLQKRGSSSLSLHLPTLINYIELHSMAI